MHSPYPVITIVDSGIAGAESDGLLKEWDHLLYRPGVELAPGELRYCGDRVGIECEHRPVFGNSLLGSALRAQNLAFGVMRKRAAGSSHQSLSDQRLRACHVGGGRVGQIIERAAGERVCQSALCIDGLRIERQGVLE